MSREDAIRQIRERYQQSGQTYNELQRRRWAAKEALRIGRGGITIVSKALRISPNTIRAGIQEIAAGDSDAPSKLRIRKPGGGRKAKTTSLEKTESSPDRTEAEPTPSSS